MLYWLIHRAMRKEKQIRVPMAYVLLALFLVSRLYSLKANECHKVCQTLLETEETVARPAPMNVLDSWDNHLHRIRREASTEERGNIIENKINEQNTPEEEYDNMENMVCPGRNESLIERMKEFNEQLARIREQFSRADQGERLTSDELKAHFQMMEATEYRTQANITGDGVVSIQDIINIRVPFDTYDEVRENIPPEELEETTGEINNSDIHGERKTQKNEQLSSTDKIKNIGTQSERNMNEYANTDEGKHNSSRLQIKIIKKTKNGTKLKRKRRIRSKTNRTKIQKKRKIRIITNRTKIQRKTIRNKTIKTKIQSKRIRRKTNRTKIPTEKNQQD
uniref:Uncharacterized protein n=1 Tax=Cacopsylla melanoneura TaxID=428564 RepID=A0A8D9A7T1_9HEMI